MNWESLLAQYGIYVTTFLVCLIGGIVPVVNTEAYLIAISIFFGKETAFLPVVLIASATHIIAKILIYLTGKGVLKLPLKKYEKRVEQVTERLERWKASPMLFIFISAGTSLPSFYLVSLTAGAIRYNLTRYIISGTLGLIFRYTMVWHFPQFFMRLFS